ncbi:MAG: iron-only hydrogenase system regulator [Lachnospiraceae bacterium]|nr:iron-only hydrogenase system regulator [Lachnospiraceae bacterium]
MKTKVALVGVIVEEIKSSGEVNEILHDFEPYIIGRMGVPYRERGLKVISVVLDAKSGVIDDLSEKLDKVKGIKVKTMYADSEE